MGMARAAKCAILSLWNDIAVEQMQNGAQEVADVLELTAGREVAPDVPWCPPGDAVVLRRWIIDRPPTLGGGIRRAVRLAAAASLCDRRGYVPVLYGQIQMLRAQAFRQVFVGARATLAARGIEAGDVGLRIKADGTGDRSAPFEISYAQMPRLAALLDVLHNALGYGPVADMLAPACAAPTAANEDVSRKLHAALSAWLTERLGTAHHLRQAQAIRRFLGRRHELHPGRITDESILALWEAGAATSDAKTDGAGVEGFRMYRSAVRAVLTFRQAMLDAMEEARATATLGDDHLMNLDADEVRQAAGGTSPLDPATALARLIEGSDGEVRWLSQAEAAKLADVLGVHQPDDEEEADAKGGLAGDRPVPLDYARTVLRAAVFAPAQARILAALRRRGREADAVSRGVDALPEHAYADAAAALADLEAHVRRALLLASAGLLRQTHPQGLVGLLHEAEPDLRSALIDPPRAPAAQPRADADADEAAVHATVRVARDRLSGDDAAAAIVALRQRIRSAERAMTRAGFKPADQSRPDVRDALARGIEPAIALLGTLPAISAALAKAACEPGALAADRPRFLARLKMLHEARDPAAATPGDGSPPQV